MRVTGRDDDSRGVPGEGETIGTRRPGEARPASPERIIELFHHRWAVPVIAALKESAGAKFVTLAARLGVSRDSLKRTLDALRRDGLVIRNPGYGHPMRPEYILTEAGGEVAPWCVRAVTLLDRIGSSGMTRRKWSLGVALALHSGRSRFSEMMEFLPGITPRALTSALRSLMAEGLVERVVSEGYPPVPRYRLTRQGRRLGALFEAGE